MVNQGVQTDQDSRITNVLELVRANYQQIERLEALLETRIQSQE